jgi:hypothetical protein
MPSRIVASEVGLPIHPYLTDDEIARVIERLAAGCALDFETKQARPE